MTGSQRQEQTAAKGLNVPLLFGAKGAKPNKTL